MRIFFAASLALVSASAFAQNYEEGIFSQPSPTIAKVTAEVKVKVWSSPQATRVEIGSHLLLVVNDSPNNPGFKLLDRTNGQLVTVNADAASLPQLAAWEGSIFPLLPTHAGFAASWPDFSQQVSELVDEPLAHVSNKVSRKSGLENVAYNSSIFDGKVSWDFDSSSHQMVSWSYTPRSGRTRSLHLGEGLVSTPYQRISYGADTNDAISKVMYLQKSSVSLVNGQFVLNSGFLQNADQAVQWLKARTAYMLD